MQLKTALLAGLASALLTAALPVIAAPGPMPPPPPPIPFAQVKAAADKAWERLDANHDGRIDAADRDARLLQQFAQWDTNHDGMISKDEFLAQIHAREARRGKGWRDGPSPHDRGDAAWHGPDSAQAARDHGGPGQHPGGFAAMMIVRTAMQDARQNDVITRAAFDAAVKARFDAIDTNHDGQLSHEELRATRGQGWRGNGGHGDWRRDRGGNAPMPPAAPTPPPPAPGGANQ